MNTDLGAVTVFSSETVMHLCFPPPEEGVGQVSSPSVLPSGLLVGTRAPGHVILAELTGVSAFCCNGDESTCLTSVTGESQG